MCALHCFSAENYRARKDSGLPLEQTVVVHAGFIQVEDKVGRGSAVMGEWWGAPVQLGQ